MIATALRTPGAVQVEVSAAVAMDPGRQEKVVFHMVYTRTYTYILYEYIICIYIIICIYFDICTCAYFDICTDDD